MQEKNTVEVRVFSRILFACVLQYEEENSSCIKPKRKLGREGGSRGTLFKMCNDTCLL